MRQNQLSVPYFLLVKTDHRKVFLCKIQIEGINCVPFVHAENRNLSCHEGVILAISDADICIIKIEHCRNPVILSLIGLYFERSPGAARILCLYVDRSPLGQMNAVDEIVSVLIFVEGGQLRHISVVVHQIGFQQERLIYIGCEAQAESIISGLCSLVGIPVLLAVLRDRDLCRDRRDLFSRRNTALTLPTGAVPYITCIC